MAKLLNKDPKAYEVERDRFLVDLKRFHDSKGTPYRNLPMIDGKEIDLYMLYWTVTAHGGWEKVNAKSGWDEILPLFDLPESSANGALAIKQIYLRYLDSYEKVHFLGEEEDDNESWYNDEEDSRMRRHKAQKAAVTVPLVYNTVQHKISDEDRTNLGLCTNVYRKSDYEKLTMSLLSPLPNEQDFAINVCTLLSNEGRHTLKLTKCPRLLDLLLAHAGIYNHENLKTYMNELYFSIRNYDLLGFWNNVCKDVSTRDLMLKYSESSKHWSKANTDILALETSQNRLEAVKKRASEEIESHTDDEAIFACGANLGTQELSGQRILQIGTILRNLSFEEDNALVLAHNETLLRFCLLCCSTKWSNLNQVGFDILCNIAADVVLEDHEESVITDVLLSTLATCIASPDRFQVISSLDVLNKLCQQPANEWKISHLLVGQRAIYDQLIVYLSLHDMHLLISTLECLYSMSCLGELSCNAIVRTHGAVDALVSLITVEAQSYGPKACILMRVVETVPGTSMTAAAAAHAQQQRLQQQQQQQQKVVGSLVTTPVASSGQIVQTVTSVRPQTTNMTIVSSSQQGQQQPQIVRGPQVIQVQRPGGPVNVVQYRGQALPAGTIVRPGQQQGQLIIQRSQPQQQPQQHIVLQQGQAGVSQQISIRPQVSQTADTVIQGSARLATSQAATGQVRTALQQQQAQIIQQHQQQLQQQQQQQRVVQTPQLNQALSMQQPQRSQQPQQPTQPQQVQLRLSNDEAHRTFCLSWLKATYEAASNCSIQHEIMYKQYLASLHKLGKREVISGPLYAACVRSIFGGSVGPHKRQTTDGKVDQFFEGVRVRAQPLPLRIPVTANQTTQPSSFLAKPVPNVSGNAVQNSVGTTNVVQQQTITGVPVNQAVIRNQMQTQQSPSSPILTNLLHRSSAVTETKIDSEQQVVQGKLLNGDGGTNKSLQVRNLLASKLAQKQQVQLQPQQQTMNESKETSVLDGILPKDGLSLNKNAEIKQPMVNGVENKFKNMNGGNENNQAASNMLKRPSNNNCSEVDGAPAAKAMMIANTVEVPSQPLTNGEIEVIKPVIRKDPNNLAQAAIQKQSVVIKEAAINAVAVQPQMVAAVGAGSASGGLSNQIPVSNQVNSVTPGTTGKAVMVVQKPNVTPTAVANGSGNTEEPPVNGQVNGSSQAQGNQSQNLAANTPPLALQSVASSETASSSSVPPSSNETSTIVENPTNASTTASVESSTASSASASSTSTAKPNPQAPFLCEWQGCMRAFKTPKAVENHAIQVHCPLGRDDIPCLWQRCDGMKRKRFSLMTHIQDRHCHPQLMKLMALRRVQMATTGRSHVPLPPAPPPHPGYAPNAALHAIKRHAAEFATPKAQAMGDEKEGPVTKSIRLTSSLILKNLVIHSGLGKKQLKSYESHLATVALSNVEASRTVSQILYELNNDEAQLN